MTRPERISIPEPPAWIANENFGAYYFAYLDHTRPPWPTRPHGQMSEDSRSAQMCGVATAWKDGWQWTAYEEKKGRALHKVLSNIVVIRDAMSRASHKARRAFFESLDEPMQADRGPSYLDLWPGGLDAVLGAL